MRIPRMSMMRSMVAIGAISTWLWLTRTDAGWMIGGTLVLALMLHAANRRVLVARERDGDRPTALSRAGLLGYSIAVVLGLAWVASVVVWDAYEHERRSDEQRRWGQRPSILSDFARYLERALQPSPPARPRLAPGPSIPIRVKPGTP